MLIILKHIYTQEEVTIETPNNDPDAEISKDNIKMLGRTEEVERFQKEINQTLGFYGHLIDLSQGTNNLDLFAGVGALPSFSVAFAEKVFSAPLPEEAIG